MTKFPFTSTLISFLLDLCLQCKPLFNIWSHFFRAAHWTSFIQRLQLLGSNSLALRNSKTLTPEALIQLTSDSHIVLHQECKTASSQKYHAVMASGSLASSAGLCHGNSRSALWLPLDLVLEDAMDGYQVDATSSVETITGKHKIYYPFCLKLNGILNNFWFL